MPIDKFFAPESLQEALDVLNQYGSDVLILAGGTMVMPLLNEALTSPRVVLSLQLAGLDALHFNESVEGGTTANLSRLNIQVEIGATIKLSRVSELAQIPLLAMATRQIGSWAIRNMATLGGNIFAPPPSGDAAVALLALGAQIVVESKGSQRKIPMDQIYTGMLQTSLKPNELVTRIDIPKVRGKTAWIKYARREANSPSVVAVAARIVTDPEGVITEARIALGGANHFPMRATQAEATLMGRGLNAASIGDAAKAAMNEAKPFSDALASDWYRKKMVGVYVRRTLETIK